MPEPSDEQVVPPGPNDGGRLRRWVEQGRQWTDLEKTKVESALQERRHTSSVIGAGFDIRELDVHVGGGILAGAVAFRMFLFLVPFVYIVFSLAGLTARTISQDPAHLAKTVGITGVLASALVDSQNISLASQIALLVGATIALVFTANSLAKTLYVVHWLVWRFSRAKPSGWRPIALTVAVALVMTVLSVAGNKLRSDLGLAGSLLVLVVLTAVSFAVWWWVSWQLPHAPMSPRRLVPGALFVALGTLVMHAFTTYVIGPYVAHKSHTYGAVGIALAVLLWVYVFGRIIVGSAGINVTLWRRSGAGLTNRPGGADGPAAGAPLGSGEDVVAPLRESGGTPVAEA
ncbi:MAG TPA: YihY/virulence factor BrkB family protein [Acidimicrobiales bacterium]|nr:YihY/virulence factor BrkB family protein [Acidimicrobiales bacterium]